MNISTVSLLVGIAGGLIGGTIAVLTVLWKFAGLVAALRTRDLELENEQEKQLLYLNGVREAHEHFKLRATQDLSQLRDTIQDVEGWLVKHTEYVQRRSR